MKLLNSYLFQIVISFILLILSIVIIVLNQPRLNQYNAHVCAVNGYQPDCITKLK